MGHGAVWPSEAEAGVDMWAKVEGRVAMGILTDGEADDLIVVRGL